eukprot:892894-Alexandrium_andersonii.AAC.1
MRGILHPTPSAWSRQRTRGLHAERANHAGGALQPLLAPDRLPRLRGGRNKFWDLPRALGLAPDR